jgi:vacuolar-type H+-ATPase subunit H
MGLSLLFKNLLSKTKHTSANLVSQTDINSKESDQTSTRYIGKTEIFIEEALTKVKEVSEPIFEDASEYADKAKDIISEYVEKATDSINDIIDSVKESLEGDDTQQIVYDTVVDLSEKPITETE